MRQIEILLYMFTTTFSDNKISDYENTLLRKSQIINKLIFNAKARLLESLGVFSLSDAGNGKIIHNII